MDVKLSDNFYLSEFTNSQTAIREGITNTPPDFAMNNLRNLALLMELVRKKLGGKPITISSGFRSPAVNALVGGSMNSDHGRGNACDFICPAFGTPKDVARAIVESKLPFGQIIWEGTWVHISLEDKLPANKVLTAVFSDGRVRYIPGI